MRPLGTSVRGAVLRFHTTIVSLVCQTSNVFVRIFLKESNCQLPAFFPLLGGFVSRTKKHNNRGGGGKREVAWRAGVSACLQVKQVKAKQLIH
jgi:hypothetical protein